jgi:hypothetical protein
VVGLPGGFLFLEVEMNDLLTSRKFWAAVLSLIVILIAAISPAFQLDVDQAAGFAIIVVSYIVGVAVDPGPGGWRGIVQSRKFWAAFIGLAILFLDAFKIIIPFGLAAEQLIAIAVTIGGYIAGVAAEKPKAVVITELDEHDIRSYG